MHAIFGSFLVGMIMPRDCKFTLHMCEKIDDLVSSIFLPLYFALSGLKTDIASISHAIGGGAWPVVSCVWVWIDLALRADHLYLHPHPKNTS